MFYLHLQTILILIIIKFNHVVPEVVELGVPSATKHMKQSMSSMLCLHQTSHVRLHRPQYVLCVIPSLAPTPAFRPLLQAFTHLCRTG